LLIVDGHCDTLSRCQATGQSLTENNLHWDINRARGAGIGIQFMAMFNRKPDYETALAATIEQIAILRATVENGKIRLITEAQHLGTNELIGVVLHLEGAVALGHNSDLLPLLYQLGLRSMGLTWNHRNQLADGVLESNPGGLTNRGQVVLRQADRLGMIIDLAHLAAPGVDEVLDNYTGTVVYTHGNYHEVYAHPRNITRQQARRLAERGGVIGLSFYPGFISLHPSLEDWLQHLRCLCDDIGCEHVVLGSDYDGDDELLLGGDVSFYGQLPVILKQAGFTAQEAEMITSGNWLRILQRTLPNSKRVGLINGI